MGGTKIDSMNSGCMFELHVSLLYLTTFLTENEKGFLGHFRDEIKNQFRDQFGGNKKG